MRRRSGRGFRARSSGKRETLWTSVLIDNDDVPTAAAVTGPNLVDRTDWTLNTSFTRGGTLERIRGNLSLSAYGVSVNASERVWMGIWLVNDDETAPDPSNATDMAENDLLWHAVYAPGQINLTAVGVWAPPVQQIEIDVKARRKLESNSLVIFTYRGTGTNNYCFMSASFRTLIKKV